MSDPRPPTGLIATSRQLLLIAVLGVIAAGVLIAQFGGASASPEGPASAGVNPPARAAAGASGPTKAPGPAPPVASARNQRDSVALIGTCTVRVGDVIEGYRVQSIGAGGVLLVPSERLDARAEPKR